MLQNVVQDGAELCVVVMALQDGARWFRVMVGGAGCGAGWRFVMQGGAG